VIVIADVFVELGAYVSERPNEMVQSAGVGVNEHLISVSISRKT
jgi:hypothetical protein